MELFIKSEIDSIEYCLKNNIKVIIILEPHIKPFHYTPPFETGFRDENVGPILSDCHKIQQQQYAIELAKRYLGNKNVVVIDMREFFRDSYKELFYDECHLNGKGNTVKAAIVYGVLLKLFPQP